MHAGALASPQASTQDLLPVVFRTALILLRVRRRQDVFVLSPPREDADADRQRYHWPQFPELVENIAGEQIEVREQADHAHRDQDGRSEPVPLSSFPPAHTASNMILRRAS